MPGSPASKKEYVYSFYSGTAPDPFLRRYAAYTPYPIRLDEMQKAAAHYTVRTILPLFAPPAVLSKAQFEMFFPAKSNKMAL